MVQTHQGSQTSGWVCLLLFVVPYWIIVGVFGFRGDFIPGQARTWVSTDETTMQQLIGSFFGLLGTLLVVVLFMPWMDKLPFMGLGLYPKEQTKCTEFRFMGTEFFLTLLLFLFVSGTEEIVFRGHILRNLMESTNHYTALLPSVRIVALAHGADRIG